MKRIVMLVLLVIGVLSVFLTGWVVGMDMGRGERAVLNDSLQELMRQTTRLREADAKLKEADTQLKEDCQIHRH